MRAQRQLNQGGKSLPEEPCLPYPLEGQPARRSNSGSWLHEDGATVEKALPFFPLPSFFLPRFGPRFPALVDAYDRQIRTLAMEIATHLGYASFVKEGVYCMVGGPNFESVAEARLLRLLGADAVGKKGHSRAWGNPP